MYAAGKLALLSTCLHFLEVFPLFRKRWFCRVLRQKSEKWFQRWVTKKRNIDIGPIYGVTKCFTNNGCRVYHFACRISPEFLKFATLLKIAPIDFDFVTFQICSPKMHSTVWWRRLRKWKVSSHTSRSEWESSLKVIMRFKHENVKRNFISTLILWWMQRSWCTFRFSLAVMFGGKECVN